MFFPAESVNTKKRFYCICIQASSKKEEDRKRYYLLPLLLTFPISQLKRPIEKGSKFIHQSVDKQEWSLFGIHQATPPSQKDKKKGKIHPPLVDNQEWNLPSYPPLPPPPPLPSSFPNPPHTTQKTNFQ